MTALDLTFQQGVTIAVLIAVVATLILTGCVRTSSR